MPEKDYSYLEILHIVNDLLALHIDKMKDEELAFVMNVHELNKNSKLSSNNRDKLIKLYDGVRDIPGE